MKKKPYTMYLVCNLDDSNIIFQQLLAKLNAIGIHHTLTKNTYRNCTEDDDDKLYIDKKNPNNKQLQYKREIIHYFEKQYYLNLEQMNSNSNSQQKKKNNSKNINSVEESDEEESCSRSSDKTKKDQKANSYLKVNSMVFYYIKIDFRSIFALRDETSKVKNKSAK